MAKTIFVAGVSVWIPGDAVLTFGGPTLPNVITSDENEARRVFKELCDKHSSSDYYAPYLATYKEGTYELIDSLRDESCLGSIFKMKP